MKINILTFQFAKNYGAILQAHALSSYIKNEEKCDCEIIQYYRKGSDPSWRLYRRGKNFRVLLRNIYVFFTFNMNRTIIA